MGVYGKAIALCQETAIAFLILILEYNFILVNTLNEKNIAVGDRII
ncbi:MAG: hypothetical protein RMX96_10655 [Nostoc sp. ChiSLP02]|nr:hypothetical protein [Nostoc sp. DedSLP05]MDZ8101424.1 hypothetical protein [Nostoc sp. DedSLP01]MDZ8185300.1 hypothetical protein [Nostoc sp. ChiSLP02]